MKTNLNMIYHRAKGNEFQMEFLQTFFTKAFFAKHSDFTSDDFGNFYFYRKRHFYIFSILLYGLEKYAAIHNKECDSQVLQKLKQIAGMEIYYENLTVDEFSDIIWMLRQFYVDCNVYIPIDLVSRIISFYYPGENNPKANTSEDSDHKFQFQN